MGWLTDGGDMPSTSRETLNQVASMLSPTLRQSLAHHVTSPQGFGLELCRRFDGQAETLVKTQEDLAKTQQAATERWHEIAELKQRNRLLAALLLNDFGGRQRLWSASAVEEVLSTVEDKDLLLRRASASGDLHLRSAPTGDPEPWERL